MHLRRLLALLMLTFLSALAGCLRLPEVTAQSIRYESAHPLGGTSVLIRDVEVTEQEVKAGEYTRTTKIMGFTQSVTVEGYRRDRRPDVPVSPTLAP